MTFAQTIIYGSVSDVEQALTQDIDINEFDEYGYTPLIESAIANKADVAEFLLKKGASVNLPDMTGRTALHWAADNNNFEFCELLLKNGADANAYTLASQPVLVHPLLRGQKKLSDLFLDYGADIDFARDYINTKLLAHRYSLQGVVDIVNHKGVFIEVSYEGFFLEFTLNMLYHSLDRFIHHYSARHLQEFFPYFRAMVKSFGNASELIRFQQYSIDRERYLKRIELLLANPLLLLPVAYTGHAISFVKHQNYWVHCDRGEYGRDHGCINIYKPAHPEHINFEFCYQLLYTKHDKNFITRELDRILKVQKVTQIPIAPQIAGNCSWANIEASISSMLTLLFQSTQPNNRLLKKHINLSLHLFEEWLLWDQEQALDDCIDSFKRSSSARKASKAALLGAILMQQCHYERFRDVKRAQKILKVLMLPAYQYVLKSYMDAYCHPRMTPAGKNLHEILDECGIDARKLQD